MRVNPIKSGAQYGLVQSVLSGISDKIPIETAREMLRKTPEKLRKRFAKELARLRGKRGYRNPSESVIFYRVQAWDDDKQKWVYKGSIFTERKQAEDYEPELWLKDYMTRVVEVTKKGYKKNPSESEEQAAELSRSFHGRDNREIEEIDEIESYDENLAQLGYLVELEILTKDEKEVIPITFDYDRDGGGDTIKLCSNPDGRNLLFVGGNQRLDLLEIGVEADWEIETGKRLIEIGPVYSISYFADKHHLQGGEGQKKGTEYIHEFSEEGGIRPDLVYDTVDERMILTGGSYMVEKEGIRN